MISNLAPLWLLIERGLEEGDLLVFEEPEAHLHPAAQREMAKLLVRLVNSGIHVVMTTHSDYLLNQVNVLIQSSQLDERELKRLGISKEETISSKKVSLIHLKEGEEGFYAEPLKVDHNGIEDDSFSDVVEDLYNQGAEVEYVLSRRLDGQEKEDERQKD